MSVAAAADVTIIIKNSVTSQQGYYNFYVETKYKLRPQESHREFFKTDGEVLSYIKSILNPK